MSAAGLRDSRDRGSRGGGGFAGVSRIEMGDFYGGGMGGYMGVGGGGGGGYMEGGGGGGFDNFGGDRARKPFGTFESIPIDCSNDCLLL